MKKLYKESPCVEITKIALTNQVLSGSSISQNGKSDPASQIQNQGEQIFSPGD